MRRVAIEDACGVCNGPGAIYDCGCFDIPEGDCDCDGNLLDALGECGGDCQQDANGDGLCDFRAEWWLGTDDPGEGMGFDLNAVDGQLGEAVEALFESFTWSTIQDTSVVFNMRASGPTGTWGPVFRKLLFQPSEFEPLFEPAIVLQQGECFLAQIQEKGTAFLCSVKVDQLQKLLTIISKKAGHLTTISLQECWDFV